MIFEVKSIDVYFYRIISFLIILVSIYYYQLNHVFFGFLIILFSLMCVFSKMEILRINDCEIEIIKKPFLPIYKKVKKISFNEIKSINYIEGKVSIFSIFLNILNYVPGSIKSEDEIVINYDSGKLYRLEKIGFKKDFKKAALIIKQKTQHLV